MPTFEHGSGNELFTAACAALLVDGQPVSPRGIPTRELLGAHLILTDPRRRLVDLPPVRVLNPAFAVAEMLWILSGSDDAWIFQYNHELTRFTDGGRLQGAYGPRMRRWAGVIDQLDVVRRQLTADPDSRQGVIQLYDPVRDTRGHRDVPCTLGYRFFLRRGRLDMHTTMRSQDVWLGLPYDLFAATTLHELMAGWLGAELGVYRHDVDSLHLYDRNADAAELLPQAAGTCPAMAPLAVPWEQLANVTNGVIYGKVPDGCGASWTEFADVLASYRIRTLGERDQARKIAASLDTRLGNALVSWYDRLEDPAVAVSAWGSAR